MNHFRISRASHLPTCPDNCPFRWLVERRQGGERWEYLREFKTKVDALAFVRNEKRAPSAPEGA